MFVEAAGNIQLPRSSVHETVDDPNAVRAQTGVRDTSLEKSDANAMQEPRRFPMRLPC